MAQSNVVDDLPLSILGRDYLNNRLRDRSRKLLEIAEVTGYEAGEILLSTLYSFEETGEREGRIEGKWKKVHELAKTEKLLAAGY